METIKLEPKQELIELSLRWNVNYHLLETTILKSLVEEEYTEDSITDCGKYIWQLMEYDTIQYFIADKIGIENFTEIDISCISQLQIFNKLSDCPICGCETQTTLEEYFGDEYEETTCTHEECEYQENNSYYIFERFEDQ